MSRRPTPLLAILLCVFGVGYAVYKLVLLSRVDARKAALLVVALALLIFVLLRWGRSLMNKPKD